MKKKTKTKAKRSPPKLRVRTYDLTDCFAFGFDFPAVVHRTWARKATAARNAKKFAETYLKPGTFEIVDEVGGV